MKLLAGDIGGTNARLAIVDLEGGRAEVSNLHVFPSGERDLVEIVREFLDGLPERPSRASLAVACPIVDGKCRPTNLPWEIDLARFAEQIEVSEARVLNDFDAVGHAIPHLGPDDCRAIVEGEPVPGTPIAALGAGTGLGVAILIPEVGGSGSGRYRVVSSEGGHADFAPRDEEQWALRGFLAERYREESGGHVSRERVLSGRGIVALYEFLTAGGRADPRTRAAMAREDPAAAISRRALAGEDRAARRALEIFVEVYGAVAGDLALVAQSRGGVYVAGGIARHLLPVLAEGRFQEAFLAKGRAARLLGSVPVRVITDPLAGLVGAAWAAVE